MIVLVTDTTKALKVDDHIADKYLFIKGPDCNCPNDCTYTLYTQEMSQAQLKTGNRFMRQLHEKDKFLHNLIGK